MNLASMVVSAACALGALSGCVMSVEPIGEPGPPVIELPAGSGSVTLNWLVAGTTSAAVCAQYDAAELELVLYDATGRPVTRALTPCGSFTVSVGLPEGTYTADAALLDAGGRSVSTTKTLEAIEVVAGTDLAINLDFPSSSLR